MDQCFSYRPDTNQYCGRIHIRIMIFVALAIMAFTQFFLIIWYLSIHVWWYFIPFVFVVAAIVVFYMAIRLKNPSFIILLMLYQVLIVALFIATIINLIIILCHPGHDSFLHRHIFHMKNGSLGHIRVVAIAYTPVYFLFAVANVFVLGTLWNYRKYITEAEPGRTTNTRETNRPTPTTPASNIPPPSPVNKPTTSFGGTGVTFTPTTTTASSTSELGPSSTAVYTSTTPYSYNFNNQRDAAFGEYSSQQAGYTTGATTTPTPRPAMTPNWDAPAFQAPSYNAYQNRNQPNNSNIQQQYY